MLALVAIGWVVAAAAETGVEESAPVPLGGAELEPTTPPLLGAPERIENAEPRRPLPTVESPLVTDATVPTDGPDESPAFGPTGALYVAASSDERSGGSARAGIGGMIGVRYFPEGASATALSVLLAADLGGRGLQLGLPLRAELIVRNPSALWVPAFRLGVMVTPFLIAGPSTSTGGRAAVTLGWCLPAAFASSRPAASSVNLDSLGGLGAMRGEAALAALLVALLIMTPDLSLGYEVTSEPSGLTRSALHFSVGIGI